MFAARAIVSHAGETMIAMILMIGFSRGTPIFAMDWIIIAATPITLTELIRRKLTRVTTKRVVVIYAILIITRIEPELCAVAAMIQAKADLAPALMRILNLHAMTALTMIATVLMIMIHLIR